MKIEFLGFLPAIILCWVCLKLDFLGRYEIAAIVISLAVSLITLFGLAWALSGLVTR